MNILFFLRVSVFAYVLFVTIFAFTQVSASPIGGVRFVQLTSGPIYEGSGDPSLDANGRRVAFVSNSDFTGENGDGGPEIFLMNVDGTDIVQLTSVEHCQCWNPALNANGAKIAFGSNCDLTGQNTEHNSEIFFMNSDGTDLTQVTDFNIHSSFIPDLDFSGNKVVFTSFADLTGNIDVNTEIFMVNSDGTGMVQLTQTPNAAASSDGKLVASGLKVVFGSDGDWFGGMPYVRQLYMRNVDGGNLVLLTSFVDTALGAGVNEIAVDAALRTVAFSSYGDPLGINEDRNSEIFLLDVKTRVITQLTNTLGGRGCVFPSLSANGTVVAFECDRDLVPGSNTDGYPEVFLAILQ